MIAGWLIKTGCGYCVFSEVLQAGEVDIDEVANAIRYPLRRVHLSLIAWCGESEDEDELATMERCITALSKSLDAQERPLFIAADRVTGWAWIPVPEDAAPHAVSRLSEFVKARPDAPLIAAGEPLPGVDGFRRSHQQALATRAVILASESHTPAVTVYSDPGLVLAAQFLCRPSADANMGGRCPGPPCLRDGQ